ncbi:MAG TPA: NAD(P)-dependent oxidoreductase [Gemmatimonadales bacterium]|nr:NAD(P)-dependent oxidoreductase [Gemmatimonadales bacterium]
MDTGLPRQRVLVTGASGLIGHAAVQRFAAAGARVTGIGRSGEPDPSLLSLDLARDPWPEDRWDVIIHCAARLPLRFEGAEAAAASAENRALDDRAIAAAAATGAHLVFLSTASVYGRTIGEIADDTPAAPVLGYAQEKLASEAAIAARGLSATVFRLVAPYGPRQTRPTVLRRFLDAALTSAPLRYYGSGMRSQDFLHADDVATALLLAARERVTGRFLLASGAAISMRDLAHLIVAATGSASVVEAAGIPDPEEGRTIRYRIDQLRDRLGFQPSVSLSAGIAAWAVVRREELARGVAP